MADGDEVYGGYDQGYGGYGDNGGGGGAVQYSSFGTPIVDNPMAPSPVQWSNESLYGNYGGAPASVDPTHGGKSSTADGSYQATRAAGGGGGGMSWVDEREKRLADSWNKWQSSSGPNKGMSTTITQAPSYPGAATATSPIKTVRSYMEAPAQAAPSFVSPVFERPVVDEQAVNRRIQESLNPGLSSLRSSIREAIGRSRSSNPALQRYMMEGMMKGYGQGLGDVTSKAQKEGRQAYMEQDYKPMYDASMKNYEARMIEARANWEAALKNWQNMWTSVQESSTT